MSVIHSLSLSPTQPAHTQSLWCRLFETGFYLTLKREIKIGGLEMTRNLVGGDPTCYPSGTAEQQKEANGQSKMWAIKFLEDC